MTIAGIARRHIAKPPPPPDEPTSVQQAIDELEAIVRKAYPETDLSEIISILLTHDRLTEDDNPTVTAEDGGAVIEWWLATLARLVDEHGSINAVRNWQQAEEHRRLEEQLARNAAVRDAAIASARQAQLDDETRSLLAAAEAYLRESSDG